MILMHNTHHIDQTNNVCGCRSTITPFSLWKIEILTTYKFGQHIEIVQFGMINYSVKTGEKRQSHPIKRNWLRRVHYSTNSPSWLLTRSSNLVWNPQKRSIAWPIKLASQSSNGSWQYLFGLCLPISSIVLCKRLPIFGLVRETYTLNVLLFCLAIKPRASCSWFFWLVHFCKFIHKIRGNGERSHSGKRHDLINRYYGASLYLSRVRVLLIILLRRDHGIENWVFVVISVKLSFLSSEKKMKSKIECSRFVKKSF